MSSQATGKSLTDCPSNLKEAIDWILRVTGKDGGGGSGGTEQLATAVTDLINTAGVKNINPKITIEKILIDNLATGLATFIGYSGTNGIKSGSYKSTYGVGARWQYLQLNDGAQKCAKIFLGCLPMIFSALSYLYWRCSQPMNHGGWNEMTLGGGNGFSLRYFMESIGYNGVTDLDMTKNGSKIEGSAFSGLTEFNGAMTKATTPHPPPPSNCAYATFTKQLREEVSSQNNYDNHTLSALFICASSYFRWQQTKNAKLAYQSPSSIREMLYFLAALPYSTVYDEFDKYITSHFRTLLNKPSDTDENLKLDVADSSKTSSGGNDTLSAAELKQYLLTSCSFSAVVLGRFQGSGKAEKDSDDPWLYKLFCNSEFTFNFPSAPVLFSKFSHYTYALQFQLYFLYTQCAGTYTQERGWNQCQYGAKINASEDLRAMILPSVNMGTTINAPAAVAPTIRREKVVAKTQMHLLFRPS
ncbi:variant erythrocyte surface antigen-1 family protein [Babesia caballi]|uniref:Variant erythrocyte surface antigen-1 family protein n=1 Tax=Babesia caballi TaxID=5871 RepID=A0AAV4LNH6_BABCB|nr:variant erythrocyte surface antigen-1 family protein [Babesia caballi]